MKKEYSYPEFDIMRIKFGSIMADNIQHSIPENYGEGGEEGPDE